MGQTNKKITCEVCLNTFEKHEQKKGAMQPETICYPCWFSYLRNYISEKTSQVVSEIPSPLTQSPLDLTECLNSLEQMHKKELEELLLKKYLARKKDIRYCPSSACSYAYISN